MFLRQHFGLIRFGILLFFVLTQLTVEAQKRKGKGNILTIEGRVLVNGNSTAGVTISLLRNDERVAGNISENGRFEYDLEFNNEYVLVFSKSGYITKRVYVSTDVPERILESNNNFPPFRIEQTLYQAVEGGDYSIFDDPVAMVIYDKELDDFDYDREYDAEIEEQIKEAERQSPDTKIDKDAERSQLYAELIERADGLFEVKSYNEARDNYKQASGIKPRENYPKDKIKLIDQILGDLANREKSKNQEEAYFAFIEKADVLFEEKKYSEARSYYVEALKISPEKQHPQDQVSLIDKMENELKALERDYKKAIAEGDKLLKARKYSPAKEYYEEALGLKPDKVYPRMQIELIEGFLLDELAMKELEEDYQEAIEKADAFFKEESFGNSREMYEEALFLKPKERYPKDQISEIERRLAEIEQSMGLYASAILEADGLFEKEQWGASRKAYERAIEVKPVEVYPKEQIKRIDEKLLVIAAAGEQEKTYQEILKRADDLFQKEDWAASKDQYFAALKIKSTESYPQEQIEKLEVILADLAKKKEEDERYYTLLANADNHFNAEAWTEALVQYKAASELRIEEKYPKTQIEKVNKKIEEELARKSQEELNQRYENLIAQGDAAFGAEEWNTALIPYEEALTVKPKESYPSKQIEAIKEQLKLLAQREETDRMYQEALEKADKLFGEEVWDLAINAYEAASKINTAEVYPKNQIALIQEKQQALRDEQAKNEAYAKLIEKADKEFGNEEWEDAKETYQAGLEIKPQEIYPADQIRLIEGRLADLAAFEANEKAYKERIAEGDGQRDRASYEEALDSYQKALAIKPNAPYPQEQIAYVEAAMKRAQEEAKLQAAYEEAIRQADGAYQAADYLNAQTNYQQALTMKPLENYPKDQLALIARLMADNAAEQERLKKQLADYEEAIRQADSYLTQQEYGQAKYHYAQAVSVKPDETYPADKLKEIEELLAKEAEAKVRYTETINPNTEEEKQYVEVIGKDVAYDKEKYDNLIAQGDEAMKKNNLNFARSYYQQAYTISQQKYPKEQLDKITAQIAEQKQSVKEKEFQELLKKGDDAFKEGKLTFARVYYQQAYNVKQDPEVLKKITDIEKQLKGKN